VTIPNTSGYKVPMKIYCRKTKKTLAEAEERFNTIEIAIDFFEEFFSCPFPFKKYDMVFVPEFRINGMENVGIVIMRDTFMRPAEEKTFFEYQQWYKVAVHELSHMWFGDLVTMKWWNDLWLKESFAEYSTIVCLTECERFKYVKCPHQIGLHFLWEALNDDTKRTTHPI
jgi:aminopeptidase N